MNDADVWIDFDGPEPDGIREVLDALRDLPRATREERDRTVHGVLARLPPAPSAPLSMGTLPGPGSAVPARGPGSTVRSPTLEDRVEAAPAPPVPPPAPAPPVAPPAPSRAPAHLAVTADVLDLPLERRTGELPFRAPSPDANKAVRTLKIPVMRPPGLAETVPAGDDSITRAVAALPFSGTAEVTGMVSFPALTLEQYAAFHAELSLQPGAEERIYARYQVPNRAARRALDEHWARLFHAQPEQRAWFVRLVPQYAEYMRTVQSLPR